MKALAAALLALGVFSTAASAQWCPPGQGYGQQHPSHGRMTSPIRKPQPPAAGPETPAEPAPAPVEPVPQK
ncbi:MAG: hypothetical protein ACKVP7_14310 [Hyphomicrobiaceae bacterium]